jgi:TetR/AcrR family transcriptional repressor of bet genes
MAVMTSIFGLKWPEPARAATAEMTNKGVTMTSVQDHASVPRRKLSRTERRTQLIDATITVLAAHGYARTTLSEVARVAGLSHGLANFHFETKEKLLAATLDALSEEYRTNWQAALAQAGPSPAGRLAALLMADFNPAICAPEKLAAWCSFWGEAQGRPMYQEHCGANDADHIATLEGICAQLVRDGGYGGDPVRAARVLRVTSEGVWLDMSTTQSPYSRDEALATVWACAAAFFPRHFDTNGPITGSAPT